MNTTVYAHVECAPRVDKSIPELGVRQPIRSAITVAGICG